MLDSDPGLVRVELEQDGQEGGKVGEARLGSRASVPELTAIPILAWPIREPPQSACREVSAVMSQIKAGGSVGTVETGCAGAWPGSFWVCYIIFLGPLCPLSSRE